MLASIYTIKVFINSKIKVSAVLFVFLYITFISRLSANSSEWMASSAFCTALFVNYRHSVLPDQKSGEKMIQ